MNYINQVLNCIWLESSGGSSGDGDGGDQSLFEQRWATIGNDGIRFFVYQPGSEPQIDPDFNPKIMGYQTGTLNNSVSFSSTN